MEIYSVTSSQSLIGEGGGSKGEVALGGREEAVWDAGGLYGRACCGSSSLILTLHAPGPFALGTPLVHSVELSSASAMMIHSAVRGPD